MKAIKYILVLIGIITMISCRSVQKLVDLGDYDHAIALATKKMRGDKIKKTKHIKALEDAFLKVNQSDLEEIEFLMDRDELNAWERIYHIGNNIEYRQNLITPYLPLIGKDGYRGRFNFVNSNQILSNASDHIKNLSYEKGKQLLTLSKENHKSADAREAFYAFQRVVDFDNDYKDANVLLTEAREKGKDHVLIEALFNSHLFIPYDIERYLEGVVYIPNRNEWTEYYINHEAREEFDFIARLRINDIEISPEREKNRIFIEKREVEDGLEYVLDQDGNVKKDSLGNDIKIPKFTFVKARINEIFREKHFILRADIELVDNSNRKSIVRSINAEAHFEDYSCIINGDYRAITEKTRKRAKDYPTEFPSNIDLLFDTVNEVKRVFEREVGRMITRISA